jgi:hypothetical protein
MLDTDTTLRKARQGICAYGSNSSFQTHPPSAHATIPGKNMYATTNNQSNHASSRYSNTQQAGCACNNAPSCCKLAGPCFDSNQQIPILARSYNQSTREPHAEFARQSSQTGCAVEMGSAPSGMDGGKRKTLQRSTVLFTKIQAIIRSNRGSVIRTTLGTALLPTYEPDSPRQLRRKVVGLCKIN